MCSIRSVDLEKIYKDRSDVEGQPGAVRITSHLVERIILRLAGTRQRPSTYCHRHSPRNLDAGGSETQETLRRHMTEACLSGCRLAKKPLNPIKNRKGRLDRLMLTRTVLFRSGEKPSGVTNRSFYYSGRAKSSLCDLPLVSGTIIGTNRRSMAVVRCYCAAELGPLHLTEG